MNAYRFHRHPLYHRLIEHAGRMSGPDCHLNHLVAADRRLDTFSASGGGLFYDYSRQRVDGSVMSLLLELAEAADARQQFAAMANENLVRRQMEAVGLDPSRHVVTVTGKGSPGDQGAG